MSRNLDEVIADIELLANRLESMEKRVNTIELVAESADNQIKSIEKELIRGKSRRRKTFRRGTRHG